MLENSRYRGNLQPDRWRLHPEDFQKRMDWERKRQAILDAQAKAIAKNLPYPEERIPPIPALRFPDWHLAPTVTETVTGEETVTETVTESVTTVTRVCEECGMEVDGKARYCSAACRQKAYRSRG